MALILLVDPSDVARRALRGILARGSHRLAAVGSEQEAWDFLRRVVKVDLLFTELKLESGGGLALIQRLKDDPFLKYLPIVVYTEHGDRDLVKRTLDLRVQNFLIKPYHDTDIFQEIKKATTNPWRARHFEEEKSFCKLMGFTPAELHQMLDALRPTLETTALQLPADAALKSPVGVKTRLQALAEAGEAAGAWGVVECTTGLIGLAESSRWEDLTRQAEQLDYAARLIFQHLNSTLVPPEFLSGHELNAQHEEQERARWSNAVLENRCPVVDWPQLQRELDGLAGCPVIDSAAAAFQMSASGQASSLNPLMDLVERDPGLAAQMLIAANHLQRNQDADANPLEDPRLAVSRLGEMRLAAQAGSLVEAEERHMQVPPHFDWSRYWKFQTGVARMARFTCHYLELYSLEPTASMAGLLHDLGKLLLLRLHPFAIPAVMEYARLQHVSLREAEKYFLGCTTAEMAAYFAEKQGLPRRFSNVMRWIDSPAAATEDAVLVAVVSFARDLCRQNNVGADGETRREHPVPIEDTEEWRILSGSVYPSFNLRKFELQVHADCRELKLELLGRITARAVTGAGAAA